MISLVHHFSPRHVTWPGEIMKKTFQKPHCELTRAFLWSFVIKTFLRLSFVV